MKIVVGLGNPGKKYEQTRHNIGFEVIGSIANRYAVSGVKQKFSAEVAETSVKNEKTVLLCPLTYMNLSGKSVRKAVDFYKIDLANLLVVCDDINLDLGRLRLRASGSAGGQNGLKDIIRCLGSDQFPRLRVGVGRVPPQWDAADFVLGKFSSQDRDSADAAIRRATDAVDVWIENGIQSAMNQFNGATNQKPSTANTNRSDQTPDAETN